MTPQLEKAVEAAGQAVYGPSWSIEAVRAVYGVDMERALRAAIPYLLEPTERFHRRIWNGVQSSESTMAVARSLLACQAAALLEGQP